MKQTSGPTKKAPAEAAIKDIRRATRRQFSAEEKIRIVLEGWRGEESIAELCRCEAIAARCTTAGPRSSWKPARRGSRAATSEEVKEFRREASALEEVVADLTLENRLLRKSMIGAGEDDA